MTTPLPPATVRYAGIIAIIQSIIGLGYAAILVYRELTDQHDPSIVYETSDANTWVGYGTAVFFILVFGCVLAGAINQLRGRRWGRGPVIIMQIFLLPVSYYMFSEERYIWAAIVAISAIATLAMLFNSRAVQWASSHF